MMDTNPIENADVAGMGGSPATTIPAFTYYSLLLHIDMSLFGFFERFLMVSCKQ
jgi:hypothetical protein